MPKSLTVRETVELQPFLFASLPEVKKTKVKQWLKHGAVLVNGRRQTRHDHPLAPGDEVIIQSQGESKSSAALPKALKIVFEDAAVIVIDKPAGLLSIATEAESRNTAYARLTDYVRKGNPRGRERVFIVHRLDRETSGLMVFARTEEAKHALQTKWDAAEKRYLAIVERAPDEQEGLLVSHLDESHPGKVFSTPKSETTREARTRFRVLKRGDKHSLVELTLETGRRHQIRVQLSDIRCPIIGDEKYNARSNPAKRLGLHACFLRIPHPVTGKPVQFESPLPDALARLVAS
ncbi:MAG: RluA family pseudouridine synthase [Verrucomicrobiaceae bacterium]|nr:RluA family pseudouridine synthase [Verrucomicrobiaceae bacterium]